MSLLALTVLASTVAFPPPDWCTRTGAAEAPYTYSVRDDDGEPIVVVQSEVFRAQLKRACIKLGAGVWPIRADTELLESIVERFKACRSEPVDARSRVDAYCSRLYGADVAAPFRAISEIGASILATIVPSSEWTAKSSSGWFLVIAKTLQPIPLCVIAGFNPQFTASGIALAPSCVATDQLDPFASTAAGETQVSVTYSPGITFTVSALDGGLRWKIRRTNQSPSAYVNNWADAVAGAAERADGLFTPESERVFGNSPLDFLSGWITAYASALGSNTDQHLWRQSAPLRDWMADVLLRNPQNARGTFFRLECLTPVPSNKKRCT